uniref:Uncharacterized protein n=1 Tax=Agrobacterium albertimagni TaxID=147266 RepID=A0A7C1SXH3_9HYPH
MAGRFAGAWARSGLTAGKAIATLLQGFAVDRAPRRYADDATNEEGMSDETAPASVPEWGGDRRQGDRRGGFRDRRRPPPPWRRPWALIAYGAVGTLALLLVLLTALRQRREPVPVVSEGASATAGGAPAAGPPVPVEPGPAEAAYSAADFERLIAEGDAFSNVGHHNVIERSSSSP